MDSNRRGALIPSDHLQPVIRLVRHAVRFWRVALLAAAATTGVGLGGGALLPKHYRSEAVVYYREGLQWSTNEVMSPRRVGQRLKDVLLARVQLAKIVEDLGLYPELVKAGRFADAVEEMRRATNFKLAEGDVFVISYTGRSPTEAQRVTATLTDVLIAENARLRSQQAEVAREFLDAEKKRKADELAGKEAEQLRFLAKHPEFAQEQGTSVGVTLRASRRSAAQARDESALGALRREEQRLRRQIKTPGQIQPVSQDPTLTAAKNDAEAKLAAAQRELADRRARFTEQHPDVRMAKAAVASAEESYRRATEALDEAQKPVRVDVLKDRLARVEQDIAAYLRDHPQTKNAGADAVESSEAAKRIVAIETEWARLTREVAEARERLQQLDSQQFMASMTASMLTSGQTAQIIVIDPAFLPAHPIGWSLTKMMLMILGTALALGVGLALVLALLDDVIYDRVDVERLGIAPVLTEVGRSILAGAELALPARDGKGSSASGDGGAPPASARTVRVEVQRAATPRLALASTLDGRDDASGAAPRLMTGPVAAPPPAEASGAPLVADGARGGPAAALRAPVAESSEPNLKKATTYFSFASDFSDLVRIHRVSQPETIDRRIVMLAAPDTAAAASFRVLRHRIEEHKGVKKILVTSAHAGEGKTLTAVNLALAMGETGLARVLLLEANFRSPALAQLLGFQPPICLTQQFDIHRGLPTDEPWLVVETVAPWLHVAAVAPDGGNHPLLDGRALALCIQDLQGGYDYIIIDSPAIGESADANLIEDSVDGIVFTMRARTSRVKSFRKAVEQVGSSKLLGVVLLGS